MRRLLILKMTSQHWKAAENFHRKSHLHYAEGEKGYRAFQYLKMQLEGYWDDSGSASHPLRLLLFGASDLHYQRLMVLEAQVRMLESDPYFNDSMRRVASESESVAALQELNVFYRLRIGGLFPELVKAKSMTTPDMLVELESERFWIEVTSVNNSTQESPLIEIMNLKALIQITSDSTIGGFIVGPFGKGEMPYIEGRLMEAAASSSLNNSFEVVFLPGRLAAYAIRKDLIGEIIPTEIGHGFRYFEEGRDSHAEGIIRRIENKVKKGYTDAEKGFLVIFDPHMSDEDLKAILDFDEDLIMEFLSSNPNLIGVALIMPRNYMQDYLPYGDLAHDFRFYRTYLSLPDRGTEKVLVWLNKPKTRCQWTIASAFINFDKNQKASASP